VTADPAGIVAREGHRLQTPEVLGLVAGRAATLVELRTVAFEAGRHRREVGRVGLFRDDTRVAFDALAADLGQPVVRCVKPSQPTVQSI
jgi:hypothetical protein